ncbi:MAG: SPOR domain-containing protein [Candidatus Eisenbacteria sp.]|nr:SPOR domain-containing protein [Candidatus Eisenbacteria bacterium]
MIPARAWPSLGRTIRVGYLGQLIIAGALACPLAPPAGAGLQEDAAGIAQTIPNGPVRDQGLWLFEKGRAAADAHLAFYIMEEVTKRFEGEPAARAALWKVRFFMAAGDTASAAHQLRLVDRGALENAPWRSEQRFWSAVLGEREAGEAVRPDASVPPWGLMSRVAAMDVSEEGQARKALALEGAARRWGLLCPWLWRLASSGQPWLMNVAGAILESPGLCLSGAPEVEDIRRILEARAMEGSTKPGERRGPDSDSNIAGMGGQDAAGDKALFAIQVGAFLQESAAKSLTRELAGYGFRSYHELFSPGDGTTLFRVRIGPCATLSEAESLGAALSHTLMLSYQIVEECESALRLKPDLTPGESPEWERMDAFQGSEKREGPAQQHDIIRHQHVEEP